jgi:hypothetical protein
VVKFARQQRVTSAVFDILAVAVLAASLSTNRVGSACPQPYLTPAALSGTWCTYTSDDHGFAIRYPGDFLPEVPGDVVVLPGAVVTFVPTFDPSIGKDGVQTNLCEVSVTVGVAGFARSCPQQEPPYVALRANSALPDIRIIGGRAFTVTCSADAGAGNVYETVSYRTTWGLRYFEIVLLLHYGNLAFYPEGTVVAFNPLPFLQMLDRIVSTFQTLPLDT